MSCKIHVNKAEVAGCLGYCYQCYMVLTCIDSTNADFAIQVANKKMVSESQPDGKGEAGS